MPFVGDEEDRSRAFNPETGESISRTTRDMPLDWVQYKYFLGKRDSKFSEGREHHYRAEARFTFRARIYVVNESKTYHVVFDGADFEQAFRSCLALYGPGRVPTVEEFKVEILPSLRDAVVCLENHRLYSPRTGIQTVVEGIS